MKSNEREFFRGCFNGRGSKSLLQEAQKEKIILEVGYHKKFLKDLSALPAGYRERLEKFAFDTLSKITNVNAIPAAEKLKGYHCTGKRFIAISPSDE